MTVSETKIQMIFDHGLADDHRIDLQDAAIALQGMARALTITTDAFLNRRVVKRIDRVEGVRVYLEASRPGSVIEELVIWTMGHPIESSLASGVAGNLLTDFIKYVFRAAVGLFDDPSDAELRDRIEPVIDILPARLENPLRQVHRPIYRDRESTVGLRLAGGEHDEVTFDNVTCSSLASYEAGRSDEIRGNVTRYNVISGWGRIFDFAENRTIPFVIDRTLSAEDRHLLTWSLDRVNNVIEGEVSLSAYVTRTASHLVKKYRVVGVWK